MSPKVAGVLLVLLVVLFAVAVGVGVSGDEGSSADPGPLVERLGELAGDPSALAREAIAASCLDEDDPDLLVVPAVLGGLSGCTVVADNDDQLRLVRLLAEDPIRISAPAPEGDLEVDDDAAAGESVGVAVGEGRTEIELSCGLASSCRVRLVAE